MKSLFLTGDKNHPKVILDLDNNQYEIQGSSTMDNAEEYYESVLNWLDQLEQKALSSIDFIFNLECFNIVSSQQILQVLYKIEKLKLTKKIPVQITWCHGPDDDEMLESGQDFEVMVKVPFHYCIQKESVFS